MQAKSNIQKANKLVKLASEITDEFNKFNCITEANWQICYFDQNSFEIEVSVKSIPMPDSQFAPMVREVYHNFNLKNKIRFGFCNEAKIILTLNDFPFADEVMAERCESCKFKCKRFVFNDENVNDVNATFGCIFYEKI